MCSPDLVDPKVETVRAEVAWIGGVDQVGRSAGEGSRGIGEQREGDPGVRVGIGIASGQRDDKRSASGDLERLRSSHRFPGIRLEIGGGHPADHIPSALGRTQSVGESME